MKLAGYIAWHENEPEVNLALVRQTPQEAWGAKVAEDDEMGLLPAHEAIEDYLEMVSTGWKIREVYVSLDGEK